MTTYKYFQADSNLRSVYGGGAIQNGGDSAEINSTTLMLRHISRQVSWPSDRTKDICLIGDVAGISWVEVSDNLYTAISSFLSPTELATVTSLKPAGFTVTSQSSQFQPDPVKTNIILRSDSIGNGQGTTVGDTRDIFLTQAVNEIIGETLVFEGGEDRVAESANYRLINLSLGSSSWGNTNTGGGAAVYPQREDLAYNQRVRTIPLHGSNNIFIYWLGTNDLAYDTGLTGVQAWSRAATRISALAAEFPNLKIIVMTAIKRGETLALNDRISDFNAAVRTNFQTAGADYLLDVEAISQLNTVTGDTTDTTYYTDGVHLTTAGHGLLKSITKTAILNI